MTYNISVVIPLYNDADNIENSVMSAVNQSVQPNEIIVVDDCSTDDGVDKVKVLAEQYPVIKLLQNDENYGVWYCRNKGVQAAGGDYIAFLDSDDMWTKDKLKRQMRLFGAKGAELTFTGSSFIDEEGNKLTGYLKAPAVVDKETLLKQNIISCSSVIVKREWMLMCPMREGCIHEDFDCWLRILDHVRFAYGINEPLLKYRIRKNSRSRNKLKSAMMNYSTYRANGINKEQALRLMFFYAVNGIKKYSGIK